MVWREGRAEFFSHHDQSLHMGAQGNAMVQYFQCYVGHAIQTLLHILKVDESAKNGGKIIWWSMVWREGLHFEFFSHHAQSLPMGPKDNAMVYIGNIRLATQSRHIYIS